MKNKQLLITIEGKDCKCNCHYRPIISKHGDNPNFLNCCENFNKPKGKSPTELIFDAEDFKGKELPKKGELRCGNCSEELDYTIYGEKIIHRYTTGCKNPKPFRLSSDAVLKTRTKANVDFGRFVLESGEEKIVIVEGYYE